MPNARVKQIPADRAQRGKYKFEIRRLSPTHPQVDGMIVNAENAASAENAEKEWTANGSHRSRAFSVQAASVARRRTVEEFHRGPPASSTLADLIYVWNNNPSDPLRQS